VTCRGKITSNKRVVPCQAWKQLYAASAWGGGETTAFQRAALREMKYAPRQAVPLDCHLPGHLERNVPYRVEGTMQLCRMVTPHLVNYRSSYCVAGIPV